MNFIANMTGKHKRRYEIFFAVMLLLVMFYMRGYKLDSDPPIGLSYSTDVYTDPGQYTLFAKQKILTDDFNPYNETRFTFFLKSSVTLLALFVFKIFGVSLEASNFVGLFYSFGALLLFYLIIRKISTPLAGLIYLFLIAINYNQIFFGRLPFLEHAMTFYAFLSLTLLLYCKKAAWFVVAGGSLAVGLFFGKIIGLVFLAPFVGYFLYQYYIEKDNKLLPSVYFSVGFISVVLFWLFFSYFPMKEQVASYVGEQAFALYGAPEAFESIDNFVWKYLSFGNDSRLFTRMRIPWLFATIFISLFLFRFFGTEELKTKLKSFNSGKFFIILMIISFYGALMIWNYRPLRYQLVLIYPIYGAASILLASFFSRPVMSEKNKVPLLYIPILFVLFSPLVYQFYSAYISGMDGAFFYDDYKFVTIGWAAFLSILVYGGIILAQKYRQYFQGRILYAVPIIVVAVIYSANIEAYFYWAERPTFTARDNSKDLGLILAENGVVSGPYGSSLTMENEVGTIIHMFGVVHADRDFFKKRPITHLLIDNGNETRAKEDYPMLMDSAKLLFTYHVGLKKVRLYRIAGFTGNDIADSYRLSKYEQLLVEYDDGNGKINNDLAVEIISENSDNIACYTFLAEAAEQDSVFQLSEMMFKKAVEFSPTNYNLNARLAKFYQDRYSETNNELYKTEGKYYYEEAIKFAPTTSRLKQKLEELNES